MKHPIMTVTALNILSAAAMLAIADDSNPQVSFDPIPSGSPEKGERINMRLDRRGDRIENRMDRCGDRAERRMDRRGDSIQRRVNRKTNR